MGKDYYKILGVERNANADDIKKAFHKKAHQCHPDKTGGDAEQFKEINEAYQVLSNTQKRQQYDQFGSTFSQNGGFNGGAGATGGFEGMNINMDDLSEMFGGFGDIFGFGGGRSRSQRQQRGHDIEIILSLSFAEAVFGVDKEIKLNRQVKCEQCKGVGAQPGSEIKTCSTCQGKGRVTKIQRTILGAMQVQTTCPDCQGEGKTYSKACSKCGGTGVTRQSDTITVKIPAGINDGEVIRLTGQGEAGPKGSENGDLYIKAQVADDKRFVRDGYDILTEKEISLSQAVLGDKVEVETIDGLVSLKIPGGTESGKVFMLKNKGVTKLQGRGKGDHLVKVKIKVPNSLSREQKKLMEALQQTGL